MYIVGFNGPPESGKDTLAELLATHMDKQGVTLPVRFESLSIPLRKLAYTMVGITTEIPAILDGDFYSEFKSRHFPSLNRTGRQLMIDVSERFLKPTYGLEVMAQLLLERNEGFPGILLVRDLGFQCEVDPLVRAVGEDNLAIVSVCRAGKTFEGDSREWVDTRPDRVTRIHNNGTIDDLRTEAGRIYGRLVNQYGWKL